MESKKIGRLKFYELVKEMRRLQQAYLASNRDYKLFRDCLRAEKKVDAYIRRGEEFLYRVQQHELCEPSLFGQA